MLDNLKQKLFKQDGQGKSKNGTNRMMSFDLFYQLSYMSTIAAAGVPRDQIFERAAELDCSSAEYFKRIELARQRLKYDYARACRAVGEPLKEEEVKGLLLRFSSSLISGEPEAEFLTREAKARAEDYENEYGRSLESLKMWTDAYVSLILSAVLVIIIGVVSTMIWKIETTLIMAMAFIAIATTAIGVWLIWLVSPKEIHGPALGRLQGTKACPKAFQAGSAHRHSHRCPFYAEGTKPGTGTAGYSRSGLPGWLHHGFR